ncbi:MAG: hypothetical protein IJQ31_16790 [Thermoguttaceae bacterium]|nr:hypothetical protein [Thermoguttaceae bacterium]
MKQTLFTLGLVVLFLVAIASSGFGNPATKIIQEALEQAAKISGKSLTPASKEAAELAMKKAVVAHGDDVVKIVRIGGLETLEQGTKHGDEFWRMCAHCPDAARSLALHADDLLPLARRIGPEVLEIEARTPGMALKIAEHYGDDGLRALMNAPSDDISRLICGAQNADSPKTRELLLEKYKSSKDKAKFLESINWKVVAATGLSAAAITSAYKISDGVEEVIKTTGPSVFPEMTKGMFYLFLCLLTFCAIFLLWVIRPFLKPLVTMLEKKHEPKAKLEAELEAKPEAQPEAQPEAKSEAEPETKPETKPESDSPEVGDT